MAETPAFMEAMREVIDKNEPKENRRTIPPCIYSFREYTL